jgi:1,2-diacylglycerol 3-beta-galactosyltransferase
VLFGGQGSGVMYEIAERLNASTLDVQLILLCGRNRELEARLRSRKWRLPIVVEGFTSKVPYYMHLSDFFVGKPGPGSLSEALHMRLPVIVARNASTLPQERFNADLVVHSHYGVVVRNYREIASAVEQLLEPDFYARCRASAGALENRAVFEIPDILEGILAAHVGSAVL